MMMQGEIKDNGSSINEDNDLRISKDDNGIMYF